MVYQDQGLAVEERPRTMKDGRKLVLIVEDNELNMKLFHDLLDAHGYATHPDAQWPGRARARPAHIART